MKPAQPAVVYIGFFGCYCGGAVAVVRGVAGGGAKELALILCGRVNPI